MDRIPVFELELSDTEVVRQLPGEIAQRLRHASGAQYLDALALAALQPGTTERIFTSHEPLFVDIASRWLDLDRSTYFFQVVSAFSRILPFAPYLRSFASRYATAQDGPLSALNISELLRLDAVSIQGFLLTVFRLLSFDLEAFSGMFIPTHIQPLFQHPDRGVRYLAVRCFCSHMRAADAAAQKMIEIYSGSEPYYGQWEGTVIDYRLLGLWEEHRWQTLDTRLRERRNVRLMDTEVNMVENFETNITARTANIGGVLVPKVRWDRPVAESALVKTPTVLNNLRNIGTSLLDNRPLLLLGLPNSGKTSLVNDIARVMGQGSSMVTLHLNEQTDAKSLLGMYATSSMTGAFSWQPGVLTKAAKEGRWILVEDLDRAPPEVIGLMLPIIERGELVIPSRKERIKCAEGFRVIATMKTSLNNKGEEVAPGHSILGVRLWQRIQVQSLPLVEIRQVLTDKFPLLSSRVEILMNIYDSLCSAFHSNLAVRSSQGRTPGLRDLIKLCRRLNRRLDKLGAKTGNEETPESFQDEMFLDAVDVFIRFLPDRDLGYKLADHIAQCLQLSPQRARFCLQDRSPPYADRDSNFSIGRETCTKMKVTKATKLKYLKSASRFAPTRAALKTMEQIASAIQLAEPVLLVGETGIGKTAVIQQLANLMCQKLTVVNLSQQSESTDLLGGFRPVNLRSLAVPLLDEFNELFEQTFSAKKNQKFLASVTKSLTSGNWPRLVNLWHEAVRMAESVFRSPRDSGQPEERPEGQPSKKRKLDSPKYVALKDKWDVFNSQLADFEAQATRGDSRFAFAFVQGKIVRALRNGEWVLLDEINLATPDILENIASLLHYGSEGLPSVLLSEAGDVERVYGHPNFRIFGAMNPATDAGKRDLAPGLRSRFTEVYVHSPDVDLDDLLGLIQTYLGDLTQSDLRLSSDVANLYLDTKRLSVENRLTDGAGQKPHFSIRTLVRSLIYIVDHVQVYGIRRAAYEGFCMSFLTLLSQESEKLVVPLIEKYIFGSAKNARSLLSQAPRPPTDGNDYVQFKHYWMRRGPFNSEKQPHYIITPFIEKNLKNLLRASSTRRFPILLQGPTSSGKTSMVGYLAKISGNKFVRINNHEHTDLQEYLGSYVSTDDGTLRYQEGVLVEALRNGYWIVLDELNLAPSDVLEALNRLLDDNRELFLPETQEVIHPHPNFMLFATQNPAGLYGGRKVLSRAFRNRFLELHFDDIPEDELEFILKERTQIAPSFCARIVTVYKKLSVLRQSSRLFEQKNSFATLRDLFRWALRQADDRETLAINGFMLLAERVRNSQERAAVKKVIEEVMKVKIDEDAIYSSSELNRLSQGRENVSKGIVWTKAMRRVFVLISQALQNNEPVLLVGETGCGKTQICQAISEIHGKNLMIVNAHVNLETGDLIGAQRPLRNRSHLEQQLRDDLRTLLSTNEISSSSPQENSLEELKAQFAKLTPQQLDAVDAELLQRIKTNLHRSQALFEWSDGSLVAAMKSGQYFLLDEVSLADDSVLERLNSVLEPHRTLLLAEKGPIDSFVVAQNGYQFLSTMNPGGDYGKRELSAALRNRMTEIWVPQLSEEEDILPILRSKLQIVEEWQAKAMLEFAKWFKQVFQGATSSSVSIRDLLAWVEFINRCPPSNPNFAIIQGAAMVYIDTLGANPSAMLSISLDNLPENRKICLDKLSSLFEVDAGAIYGATASVSVQNDCLRVGPFELPLSADSSPDPHFVMDAPTTIANAVRIARGLHSSKPILLEGSPGVGKTTLVESLARALGKPFTRINLSDQTDLTDLFGSDVPVEGGDVGQFAWRDAPFLRAMQHGHWVLLDEMNLASQSVLEGLNSCLDHRQQVYVAELDQTFKRHPDFVLFAAQNPHHQGGGRKGLPASFVNRFTVVYADSFTDTDMKRICSRLFPSISPGEVAQVVDFMSELNTAIIRDRRIGNIGGPWELNLRDITRWLRLAGSDGTQVPSGYFLENIISQRFRTVEDRRAISEAFSRSFGTSLPIKSYYHDMALGQLQVGLGVMKRNTIQQSIVDPCLKVLPRDLEILESLIFCVQRAWPSILVGPSGCGKTAILRKLAAIQGAELVELALSPDTDTMDLIGGFEQIDHRRQIQALAKDIAVFLHREIVSALASGLGLEPTLPLLEVYNTCGQSDVSIENLSIGLNTLQCHFDSPQFTSFISRCDILMRATQSTNKVGFEWTEGALTEAIQYGYWVVLDNANLCNASVLDRLNSLMEPNGCLVLNEQRTEDGSARVVKPHADFRLFLTMDPRNGELSRAMRNRSVEIAFLPHSDTIRQGHVPSYTLQSSLYRLRNLWRKELQTSSASTDGLSLGVRLDHIRKSELTEYQDSIRQFLSLPSVHAESNILSNVIGQYAAVAHNDLQWKLLGTSASKLGEPGSELVHPLVNEPRLIWHPNSIDRLVLVSKVQDIERELHGLQKCLITANEKSQHLKPSQMTKLERSFASNRISSLMKDSTQPVSSFLVDCVRSLHEFIQHSISPSDMSISGVSTLLEMARFCWEIYSATQTRELDEGEFQIYLQTGQRILASFSGQERQVIYASLNEFFARFKSKWTLTTGLSMRKIWETWRPATCSNTEQLSLLLDIEDAIEEFSTVALQTTMSLSQLGMMRKSLVDAQHSMLLHNADGELLVKSLKEEVRKLASATESYSSFQPPHFLNVFETICEYHDLPTIWNKTRISTHGHLNETLPLLAGRSAQSAKITSSELSVPTVLHKLALYHSREGTSNAVSPWSKSFSTDLLRHLRQVGDVSLGRLDFLQHEQQALIESVALSTSEITLAQEIVLSKTFARIFLELLRLHQDFLESSSLDVVANSLIAIEQTGGSKTTVPLVEPAENLPPDHYFARFIGDINHCIRTLHRIGKRSEEALYTLGLLSTRLAVICLRLFVPDKPYDPSLGLVIERRRHTERVSQLENQDHALMSFESEFTGRYSNFRRRLIAEELQTLGEAPPASPVSRPSKSQLLELQGEFTNLFNSVLGRNPEKYNPAEFQQYGRLLTDNIRLICTRLRQNFRPYDDITVLVTRFLQLLDFGVSICYNGSISATSADTLLEFITEITPLLGGNGKLLKYGHMERRGALKDPLDVRLQHLASLVLQHSVDPSTLTLQSRLYELQDILKSIHSLWKTQLTEEQRETSQRNQMYRYKGSFEDNEEVEESELRELFPTFEDYTEEVPSTKPRIDPQSIAVKLTQLHTAIFRHDDVQARMRKFILDSTHLLGSLDSENYPSPSPKSHLSGILLALADSMKIYGQVSARHYNFYSDPNIVEAKRLVSLVLSIRSRFLQLQTSWPEHAAIHDVLICCQEILAFKHQEPLAKYITKLEKLHSFVHEWQLVASKEFSAASLYDNITALVISWRRLELSTWAKLLDIEYEKCEQAVSSWWFVVYEVLIAVPLQMAENGEDLQSYTKESLATLEGFFKSTTIGQYGARLRLVEAFRSLLLLFVQQYPALKCVIAGLENFLEHYRHFEPAISKSLEEGRSSLEKNVKEQIQLASWKDTNITALRESARRSHYKLFKYVRKYRELLSRPTDSLLQQGMPELQEQQYDYALNKPEFVVFSGTSLSEALDICQGQHALWMKRAPRFKDPAATASNMLRIYENSIPDLDVSAQLSSFVSDVIDSIKTFKENTPGTLTDDNKDDVQHLKTQKRRFYSETLRQLHFMGIRRNVSTVFIEEQLTTVQVLATTPSLGCIDGPSSSLAKSADSYFQRLLDVLPRVRLSSREYNEDLNPAEVTRSAGSAEGFLVMIRRQRHSLGPVIERLPILQSTSNKMRSLWGNGQQQLHQDNSSRTIARDTVFKRVLWLIPLLGVSMEVAEIHATCSDSSSVASILQGWRDTLIQFESEIKRIPDLPTNISSQATCTTENQVVESLQQFNSELHELINQRPELEFLLEQIVSWLQFSFSNGTAEEKRDLALEDLNERYLSVVDKILVGLQGLRSSLASLPPNVDEKDWLSQTDSVLAKSLRELHIEDIHSSLVSVLAQLQYLQPSDSTLSPAAAIIAGLLPIVNQYVNICQDLVHRYLSIHREICKMAYIFSKSFTQIASEGFCSPHEASTEQSGSGKVESGTGLGDGEGAEDISKDVQDDEDLSDLAQEQNAEKSSKEDMQQSEDAVNMDQEDLEGEYDENKDKEDADESGSDDDEAENDDIDEEVGSVDDLDPNAVDEKMWDGGHDEQQKETENEEGKGVSDADEQAASSEKKKNQEQQEADEQGDEGEDEEEEEAPENEAEAVGKEELDVTDPHAKEEQALDLPEEMQLGGDENGGESDDDDDGMDELSDFEPDTTDDKQEQTGEETMEDETTPKPEDVDMDEHEGEAEEGDDNGEADKAGDEETVDEPDQEDTMRSQLDDMTAADENVAESEAVSGGVGLDNDNKDEKGASGNAQQEGGSEEAGSEELPNGAAEEGQDRKKAEDSSGGTGDDMQDDPQAQAFKKLGDVLEQWHRRQKEIMNSSEDRNSQALPPDTDMADADFEHLADDEDVADTQALGQASEEQAKALDDRKGVETEPPTSTDDILPDAADNDKDARDEEHLDEAAMDLDAADQSTAAGTDAAKNTTFVGEPSNGKDGQPPVAEELDEVDNHLAAIHLSSVLAPKTSADEARQLWSHYEAVTNDLSLSLTEQLRLILAPTLATKLRGDFRTGKRLNIKKIIPYIASQYKRDKIWMRRSIPSKRNYQVMLAVDDSKSMLESGSGQLAFETLALVARSLNMLEVGDLCIVGFGDEEHVRVAHDFGKPFSSEAGIQVFQQFSYQQTGTNVRKLVADSIALFREARAKRSGGGSGNSADLWQLELIISDGICEDHETIRRLVRQAQEERIMIVFIILDAAKGSSILDLTQASFEPDESSTGTGEMKLKMKRYLEGFPFAYYLVVRDVRELPAVLAMALKQWFAEVVDTSS